MSKVVFLEKPLLLQSAQPRIDSCAWRAMPLIFCFYCRLPVLPLPKIFPTKNLSFYDAYPFFFSLNFFDSLSLFLSLTFFTLTHNFSIFNFGPSNAIFLSHLSLISLAFHFLHPCFPSVQCLHLPKINFLLSVRGLYVFLIESRKNSAEFSQNMSHPWYQFSWWYRGRRRRRPHIAAIVEGREPPEQTTVRGRPPETNNWKKRVRNNLPCIHWANLFLFGPSFGMP